MTPILKKRTLNRPNRDRLNQITVASLSGS